MLHNVTYMNKWRAIRVREDLYNVMKERADSNKRSLAGYLDELLRKVIKNDE